MSHHHTALSAAFHHDPRHRHASEIERVHTAMARRCLRGRDADAPESKTIRPSVPGGSDLARMKEILLALKREGDKAPGAAGF